MLQCTCREEWNGPTLAGHAPDCPYYMDNDGVPDMLNKDEAASLLVHVERSLEMSAYPEPDEIDQSAIRKLRAIAEAEDPPREAA